MTTVQLTGTKQTPGPRQTGPGVNLSDVTSVLVRHAADRGLGDLDEETAGVLGVKEDDTGASGSDGGLAGEDGATLLEGGDRLVQVVGAVAHLLDHILILGNVLSNGAVFAERGEQLNDGRLLAALAGTEHGLLDAMSLVLLTEEHPEAQHVAVVLDGLVHVLDGKTDVINTRKRIVVEVLHGPIVALSTRVQPGGVGIPGALCTGVLQAMERCGLCAQWFAQLAAGQIMPTR